MQREANRTLPAHLLQSLPDEPREQHEVIVVDPDQRVLGDFVDNGVCEDLVDSLVGTPRGIFEDHPGLVVQNWPENGVYSFRLLCLFLS